MTQQGKRLVITDQQFGQVPEAEAVANRLGIRLEANQARTEEETIAVTSGADAILNQYAPITARVLENLAPRATVVRYGIGYDNIDVAAARELGVSVAIVPDYGVDTVADHAVAMILGSLRRVTVYDRAIRENRTWITAPSVGTVLALSNTTVGIVGMGRIGRAVAHRLVPFGIRIIAHAPTADPALMAQMGISLVSMDEMYSTADAISLHVPVTPVTKYMIHAETLSQMKPHAILVNTARGALVDSAALDHALRTGIIAGAALDVVDPEPLPADSPLWATPNLVITPHVSYYSDLSMANLEMLAALEAERALRNEPLHNGIC